ncbi:MAG: 16S rRNA (cytidine(1402)-2'-O)-methyltransferase [Bacteroidetes bacterium]|nr:MAG: 16S rRNA (cytidine(1402)-2'-O)-methyltransferase [Bacteroidota bacterium]
MSRITLVPTPIGNLEDITLRALRILREADLIAAEDTRTSGNLLRHFEISTPLTALHAHNEHRRIPALLLEVKEKGLKLAVVSDAGTPGVSDPGFLIVREALRLEIPVEVLPGPVAFVPALVGSGLPCDSFVFEGFLPQKKGRQTRLKLLATEVRTIILYESPHRLVKALEEMATFWGAERPACVCRELTKMHEEFRRGTLTELATHYAQTTVKGEIVIVVGGA